MQITLMQGILLAIMTIIVGLDFFVEAFFVFRPLMVSTFTGIILGDVVLGLDTFNKLGYKAKINTHTTSYIN